MADTRELVERLDAAYKSGQGVGQLWNLLDEAVQEIERQQAEIEALTKLAADRLEQMLLDRKQALTWRDEVERLTKLLKMIAGRARAFRSYPMGNHLPEVFAELGQEPPETYYPDRTAELDALRKDAERWQKWLPWLRTLGRKPYGLAKELDAIDAAKEKA